MKKISTLLILVLCLALAACGQANSAPGAQVPVKDGDATSAGAQTSSAKTETTEGLPEDFVEPTSVVEETTPDGGLVAFYLDAIGRPMESIQDFSGYHHEFTYYPSGGTKIWITTDPAGYYSENHYMDNGYVEDGIRHDGWVTYSKTIAPDGIVTEGTYEYSENGNRIEKSTSSDGSYMETRYENEMVTFNSCQFADGSYNENHYESGIQTYSLYKGTDGSYSEYYYENGEKTRYLYKNPNGSSGEERYENGSVTFSSYTHFDGDHNEVHYENGEKTKIIYKDAQGNYGEEHFKNNVLIKQAIGNSEGEQITEFDLEGNPVYVYNRSSDGSFYEQQFENGKLKSSKSQSIDGTYQEQRYENGILTYFLQRGLGNTLLEENYENGVLTRRVQSANDFYSEELYEGTNLIKKTEKSRDGERTETFDTNRKVIAASGVLQNGDVFEERYENGVMVYKLQKKKDGSFTETQWMSNNVIEASGKYNDAEILTYYLWKGPSGETKEYFFDDAGVLIKYIEGAAVIEDAAKLAEIAAKLDLENN